MFKQIALDLPGYQLCALALVKKQRDHCSRDVLPIAKELGQQATMRRGVSVFCNRRVDMIAPVASVVCIAILVVYGHVYATLC